MTTQETEIYDVIVAGAGMGGLSAGSLLAKAGYSVLLLEAGHVAGGCSSSYFRKGYVFESGATTLIGFDDYQPMKMLEDLLDLKIPKKQIHPSMTVHLNGKQIIRWQDREKWIKEVTNFFGEPQEQRRFWELCFDISDVVWKVSGKNNYFPPLRISDFGELLKNDVRDVWVLPYALSSVKKTATDMGISNPEFFLFLDEQLIISAQSPSRETPMLFGAPAVTYTNYTNFYVPGGLIEMVHSLTSNMESNGGKLKVKEKVISIERINDLIEVKTSKEKSYRSRSFISNIPVWNMGDITHGAMKNYFQKESAKYDKAWGAFTMGVVTDDPFPIEMTLHHQIHIDENEKINGLGSNSIFISFSDKEDKNRIKEHGERVLNISTHADPDYWFALNGSYDDQKEAVQEQIIHLLRKKLPYFSEAKLKLVFSSTPVTWSNWVYRKKGRVGGIPQSMSRSLLDWTPNQTPFSGIFLCGDTVFPGQGIPGVTLSGINVYLRVLKYLKKSIK